MRTAARALQVRALLFRDLLTDPSVAGSRSKDVVSLARVE